MENKNIAYVVIAVMCLLLCVGITIQIKVVNQSDLEIAQTYEENELRTEILKQRDEYAKNTEELVKQEHILEEERITVTQNDTQLESIRKQIEQSEKIAGLTEVNGAGVVVTLADGNYDYETLVNPTMVLVHDADVLGIINELKNAGAEAISINEQRIISTTSIECGGNVININGQKIGAPFEIKAIGLPEQLAGLSRPGGSIDVLKAYGVSASLEKSEDITIPKYNGKIVFEYATTMSY